ncbi:hypothetical protein PHISP_07598, partial [Aspergillus sp. HF37]
MRHIIALTEAGTGQHATLHILRDQEPLLISRWTIWPKHERLNHAPGAIPASHGIALRQLLGIENPERWTPPAKSGGHRGRYLWTDAFGVVNLLTMHQEYVKSAGSPEGNDMYLVLARRLVETVHGVLGRTRDGNSRLPGATDENPLGGGLRIGKMEELGPDGDGQYHHYLTVWMFALNRLSLASGDPVFNRQAVALAKAIHPRFFISTSARPRMVWKMAMDLSRPLVASEGNLDPIDGYVIFCLLQAAAIQNNDGAVLEQEIKDYRQVMQRKGEHFVSSDPLDLGMTLWTAHWLSDKEDWAARLSRRCFEQVYDLFEINRYLERNIKYRLAFREFGTCLGALCQDSEDLKVYADAIVTAWDPYMELSISAGMDPDDLRPITRVMYASALIPG